MRQPINLLFFLFTLISLGLQAQNYSIRLVTEVDKATGTNTQGLTIADLNLDTKPDAVVSNVGNGTIRILLDTGLGTAYGAPIVLNTLSSTAVAYVRDLNKDNKPDILVCYTGSSNFSVFQNNYTSGTMSSASFGSRQDFSTLISTSTNTAALNDFNGDTLTDVIVCSYNSNRLSVFKNTTSTPGGIIAFSSPSQINLAASASPSCIISDDFNGDLKPDLAVTNYGMSTISVFQNSSTATSISFLGGTYYSTASGCLNLASGDLDSDGKPDIVTSNYIAKGITILKNTTPQAGQPIAFGIGVHLSAGTTDNVNGICTEDLNQDGRPEILQTSVQSGNILIYENQSETGIINNASFLPPLSFYSGNTPIEVRSGDWNGNGVTDVAVSNYSGGNVRFFTNTSIDAGPQQQGAIVSLTNVPGGILVRLQKGKGTKRIVLAKQDSVVGSFPIDTFVYSSSAQFGLGEQLGHKNYVVYNGPLDSFVVGNLINGSTYHFAVFEYSGNGNRTNYLSVNPPRGQLKKLTIYYNKPNGNLNDTSSWGDEPTGTGKNPSNFNQASTIYILTNGTFNSLSNNLFITGQETSLRVSAIGHSLFIPAGYTLAVDSISLANGNSLVAQGNLVFNKSNFDNNTSVQYVSSNPQLVPAASYFDLTLGLSSKTTTGNLSVRNSLNLASSIDLGLFTLTLGSSATQNGTLAQNGGWIIGNLSRWCNTSTNSLYFPLSNGTSSKAVTLDFPSGITTAGIISFRFIPGKTTGTGLPLFDFTSNFVLINKISEDGVWQASSSNGFAGSTYNLSLSNGAISGVNQVSTLRIIRRNLGGNWSLLGNAGTNSGTTSNINVVRTGMSGFGEFAIAGDSTNNPLPLHFLSQEGKRLSDNQAMVSWKTTDEFGLYKISIQLLLKDGWKEMTSVRPMNKKGVNQYEVSLEINKTASICRIVGIDWDGTEWPSKSFAISPEELGLNYCEIYPNPTTDFIFMKGEAQGQTLRIFSLDGKLIEEKMDLKQNEIIQTNHLPEGTYLLEIGFPGAKPSFQRLIKH
ncbi:hypothetical protein MASR2M44_29320 [Bacteroidota bacterium]